MKTEDRPIPGLVGGYFLFKELPGGILDKSIVVCKLCRKEFAYHRSASSLRYHLNAKHVAASMELPSSSRQSRQSTLSKSTTVQLTNSLAKWIAEDSRPISVVEDQGLEAVLQIASADPTFEMPHRRTITNKIVQLYDAEKEARGNLLEDAECATVTVDHWNSGSIPGPSTAVEDFEEEMWEAAKEEESSVCSSSTRAGREDKFARDGPPRKYRKTVEDLLGKVDQMSKDIRFKIQPQTDSTSQAKRHFAELIFHETMQMDEQTWIDYQMQSFQLLMQFKQKRISQNLPQILHGSSTQTEGTGSLPHLFPTPPVPSTEQWCLPPASAQSVLPSPSQPTAAAVDPTPSPLKTPKLESDEV